MSTVPEITELNLPRERGYMTIEDDGDTIKAIIRPDLAGAVATDRLRWLRAAVVAAGEYLGKLCDKGQGVTVVSREMAAYEAYLAGRITREQYLATDPRDVVVPIATALPSWRAELERLRGMVRERQCLAGEELQRLTKLEELDALRQLVVNKKGNVAVPAVVACRFTGSFDGRATGWTASWLGHDYVSFRHPDFVANPARAAQTVLTAIDAAGAAVLAGEG